ncbi:MAG: DUF4328 domain-containing protein [Bacteroidales bacterium]|nr:DUF4328 domain-containing protein [Bacteroidales bacterium]
MKKITDNTFLGKLTLLLNVVVLVLFIVSILSLLKFDKVNVGVVNDRDAYEKAYENFVMAQHPLRQDSAEVAYYSNKLDSLKTKAVANTKDEKKSLAEMITMTTETLKEKTKIQKEHEDALVDAEAAYGPLKDAWDASNANRDSAKKGFWVLACITFLVFLVKTFFFARWDSKNLKNLHNISPWMKDGNSVASPYIAWFVPIINLIKPLSIFKEIWDETDYALENKEIVKVDKDNAVDNSGIYMGIWWALLLISCWLMNLILLFTFFKEGAFFVKTNHATMAVVAIVIMILAMLFETMLVLQYNKKNKLLVANEDKF